MKKRRKWAKYDFSESPPDCYTGVRIPTKIRKDTSAFFKVLEKWARFEKSTRGSRMGSGARLCRGKVLGTLEHP